MDSGTIIKMVSYASLDKFCNFSGPRLKNISFEKASEGFDVALRSHIRATIFSKLLFCPFSDTTIILDEFGDHFFV